METGVVIMVLALVTAPFAIWSIYNAYKQRTALAGIFELMGMQNKNSIPAIKIVRLIEDQEEQYLRVAFYNPGNCRALLLGAFLEQQGTRQIVPWSPYRPGSVAILPIEDCASDLIVESHREVIVKLPKDVDYSKDPMVWIQSSRGDAGETFRLVAEKRYLGMHQRVR